MVGVGMTEAGNIIVSWPYGDTFNFAARFPKLRAVLSDHGFDGHALTSSSFLLFAGTREAADALAAKVAEIDPGFTVEWEPGKRTEPRTFGPATQPSS